MIETIGICTSNKKQPTIITNHLHC